MAYSEALGKSRCLTSVILDNGLLLERKEHLEQTFLTQWLLGISVRYIPTLEAMNSMYSRRIAQF